MTAKGFMTKAAALLLTVYGAGVYFAGEHYTGDLRRENNTLRSSLVANDREMYATNKSLKTAKDEFVPMLNNEQRGLYIAKDSLETKVKANENTISKEEWKALKSWYYLFE